MKAPRLTKKIVADEDALGAAVNEVLLRSKASRRASRRVRKVQRTLRRAATYDAWHAYLHVEEVVNDRAAVEQDVLVRWAFEAGLRWAKGRGQTS